MNSNQSKLSGADETGIGGGYKNSLKIVAQKDNVDATSAAVLARSYTGKEEKSDWFLPSRDELNELCKYARNQETGDTSVPCDSKETLREGFAGMKYWSSSEDSAPGAWGQRFNFMQQEQVADYKGSTGYVRPVRAFKQ